MIILGDRGRARGRILLPQRSDEWRQPSQRSGLYQIENQTWFTITARTSDGLIYWRGWFDDREDADAFLEALVHHRLCGTAISPEIRRLPQHPKGLHTPLYSGWYRSEHTGEWHGDFDQLPLEYNFATVTFLTSTSGSNQTYNVPSDWNNSINFVEALGAGASGSAAGSVNFGGGAGAGAYSKTNNVALTAGGTATFRLSAGGASVSTSGTGLAGNNGPDAWLSNTGSAPTGTTEGVLAKGGNTTTPGGPPTGGAGGTAAASIGNTKNNGGSSSNGNRPSGGGGAGGPNGAGNDATAASPSNGGSGDAGSGGAAGAGVSSGTAANGGNGTEFDASHGSGGGGGGGGTGGIAATCTGGNGGLYGAAGGCGASSGSSTGISGTGAQAIVVTTYTTPETIRTNMPMLGM